MKKFDKIREELKHIVDMWEDKLLELPADVITKRKNQQNRSIKQIVGHMIDSASNNTHRIIHLQYQGSPLIFPDYASLGSNEKWIYIQDYQGENWYNMVKLWKFTHFHIAHVIGKIKRESLNNVWISALDEHISLEDMVLDFPRHLNLHLSEIEELAEA